MYYELYIDIFLLVNISIDFFILSALKLILKPEGGIIRRLAAAISGAVLLCVYLLTDIRFIKAGFIFSYVVISGLMVLIAFKFVSFYAYFKAMICFYVVSLCLNGIFNQIIYKINHFWQILLWSLFVYVIFCVLRAVIASRQRNQKILCDVKIFIGNSEIVTNGIWDTGNCLMSPYHNRGVSIVEYSVIEPYLEDCVKYSIGVYMGVDLSLKDSDFQIKAENDDESPDSVSGGNVFAVPYKTISGSGGILPVIQVNKICVKKEGEIFEYQAALLGIVMENLSPKGDYNMILTTKN